MRRSETTTPLTVITDATTARSVTARLLVLRHELREIADEGQALTERRGDALSAVDIGIDGARKQADDLGQQLAALWARRDEVSARASSLEAALARWERAEIERTGAAAEAKLLSLVTEAEKLEAEYADAMVAVGLQAKRLHAIHREMRRLKPVVVKSGRAVAVAWPKIPPGLQSALKKDPVKEMTRWRTKQPLVS